MFYFHTTFLFPSSQKKKKKNFSFFKKINKWKKRDVDKKWGRIYRLKQSCGGENEGNKIQPKNKKKGVKYKKNLINL